MLYFLTPAIDFYRLKQAGNSFRSNLRDITSYENVRFYSEAVVVKSLKLKSVTSCQESDLKTGLVRTAEIPRQGR